MSDPGKKTKNSYLSSRICRPKSIIPFRQQTLRYLREFMYAHDYLEADVPVLVPSLIPESYLEVFKTEVKDPTGKNYLSYLTASPEAYLKRLLTKGSGNIFYLGKAFRNGEPFGPLHNHEFTIFEWYRVGFTYVELMKEIEQMISFIAAKLADEFGKKLDIDFTSPWEYITVEQAFSRFVPKPATSNQQPDNLSEEFERAYVQFIEPHLGTRGKPTFLTDFPAWQSPLAKEKDASADSLLQATLGTSSEQNEYQAKHHVAERFELYINGVELINGWTELTDWQKQQKNFDKEQKLRHKLGKTPYPADTGFIEALKKVLPPCAGAAMGIDRLLMVLGGHKKLEDVILFPTSALFK